jgi:hypothetical protein
MITGAMERIQNLVPGIFPMMRNEAAYELIANKLEAQNEALKIAVEALECFSKMKDEGNAEGWFGTEAEKALAEIRKLKGETNDQRINE